MTSRHTRVFLGILAALAALCSTGPSFAQESNADPVMISKGRISYRSYCRNCHGDQGKGDGPVAELLTVKTPDLTTISARNDGEFPTEKVHSTIDGRDSVKAHGRDMPLWGDAFQLTEETDDEAVVKEKIDALVAFLRSIQVES